MNSLLHYEYGASKKAFVSTWRTSNISSGSSTSTQVKLPLIFTGSYNFRINWGDGSADTITSWNQTQTTHTYAVEGDYIIKITGTCIGWQFNNIGDRLKILSVSSWGKLRLGTNQGAYFYGCANLNLSNVSDTLDLTGTTNFTSSFEACSSLTTVNRMNEWNTSAATEMGRMFASATAFNQNIGSWNVSNVASFNSMLYNTAEFNNGGSNDINNWNLKTTGTVDMGSMFQSTIAFNQPLNNWNTSAVTNMSGMFQTTSAFNQPLNNWNTSAVTNMSGMFQTASAFNQPLNNWNTSAVTNMNAMFARVGEGTNAFNQNIGAWDVSNVSNFVYMFYRNGGNLSFNNGGSPDINNWSLKTTGTVSMEGMFVQCITFNQPINNWNTSAVTNMSGMFQGCSSFNQPLNNWNTSAVTNMSAMFVYASAFNQNIGSWNVSNVSNFSNMFAGIIIFNNGGSPDINNWSLKTTGSVDMANMFQYCKYFNQPLNNWNTSAVVNMSNMFGGWVGQPDMNFNQPLNNWNTSAVTTMAGMFGVTNGPGNHNFNQNISSWDISNVSNFTNFMAGKTAANFSSANLDAIYNGWSSRPVKPSVNISFGSAKHTTASTSGKAILTGSPNNWVITDGGI